MLRTTWDLTCPYCGHTYDHDGDFKSMDNNNCLTEICPKCDNDFYCYVDFSANYSECYKNASNE